MPMVERIPLRHTLTFPRRFSHPGRCENVAPSKQRARGNAGRPMHPQPRVEKQKPRKQVTTGSPAHRHSLRNGFNGFLRALVSAKFARMCERAVLTNRPSLDLSPFVLPPDPKPSRLYHPGEKAYREAQDALLSMLG